MVHGSGNILRGLIEGVPFALHTGNPHFFSDPTP
jgi:hypothetical protein